MEKNEYSALAKRMIAFFGSYSDEVGAPSFVKFARREGISCELIEAAREHEEFNSAYKECIEIRRDYLIDCALIKRFDSSTVKFLLGENAKCEDSADERGMEFTLRVLESRGEI